MLLHNMSAPPRTEVRAEKRGIADRIVVFSLIYALTVRGFLEKRERPEKLPEGKEFEAIPWGWLPGDRATIRARWPSPGDLFARIGDPKHLPSNGRFPYRLASRHLDPRLLPLSRSANCCRSASSLLGEPLPLPPRPRSELGKAALSADRL